MEPIIIRPSNIISRNDNRKKSNKPGGNLNTKSLQPSAPTSQSRVVSANLIPRESPLCPKHTLRNKNIMQNNRDEGFYLQIIESQTLNNNTSKSPKNSIRRDSGEDNGTIKPTQGVLESFPNMPPFDVVVRYAGIVFADLYIRQVKGGREFRRARS